MTSIRVPQFMEIFMRIVLLFVYCIFKYSIDYSTVHIDFILWLLHYEFMNKSNLPKSIKNLNDSEVQIDYMQ